MAAKMFLLKFMLLVSGGISFSCSARVGEQNMIDKPKNSSDMWLHINDECKVGSCVPYHQCEDSDGSGFFTIRTSLDNNVECESLHECCESVGQTVKTFEVTDKCGVRNSEALGRYSMVRYNETQFGEFPWMVAVLTRHLVGSKTVVVFQAGGSLIHTSVVLSTAHNYKNLDATTLVVRGGEWNTQSTYEMLPHVERRVQEMTLHEKVNYDNLHNDIALLFLKAPFNKEPHINIVCMPQPNFQHVGPCFAMGWGKDQFGNKGTYQLFLKKIGLPIVSHTKCQQQLRQTLLGEDFILDQGFLCAGGEKNVDMCTGDGGSPLVCPTPGDPNIYYQAGIVSWGISCKSENVPGVYIDVMKFKSWIDEKATEKGFII